VRHELNHLRPTAIFLILCSLSSSQLCGIATSVNQPSIGLEEFRWTSFPLSVFIDTSENARSSYVTTIREALDTWEASLWEYKTTYNDTTLPIVNFAFYVSGINSSQAYDATVVFEAEEMPTGSRVVGLTNLNWDPVTHAPQPPLIVNITTYQATASDEFVKNVAMHEFGHVLGLDHADSSDTSNGPELMYSESAIYGTVYPSTLDAYALSRLYNSRYGRPVQLPTSIPYELLTAGNPPPNIIPIPWQKLLPYLLILAGIGIIAAAVFATLNRSGRKPRPQETEVPKPPEQI